MPLPTIRKSGAANLLLSVSPGASRASAAACGRYGIPYRHPASAAPRSAACSTPPACRSAGSSSRMPTVWRLHEPAFAGVTPEEPILIPDGERYKNLQTVGRIYDALVRAARRSRQRARRDRRRRGRRHRRVRGGDLPARRPGRPDADDAARAGGQRGRRQGRRQPRAGQEPDRRVPSAGAGGRRSDAALDAAAARVPGRPLRGDQVRRDRQPRRSSRPSRRRCRRCSSATPAR